MRRDHFIYLALFLVTAAVFWPLRQHESIGFDDTAYVTDNPHVNAGLTWGGVRWAFTQSHAANWHPLTWISHMLDCQLFGLNAGPHHLVNAGFHVANSLLLFLVLKSLTGTRWRSAFVAALFALHPLHVESVAWLSERKDVLSTFFFLLVLLAYTNYVQRLKSKAQKTKAFYVLALGLFALGLLSKPMLVTVPFVLLLLDYWPLDRLHTTSLRNLAFEKIPFFSLSAASCALTIWAQQKGQAIASVDALPLFVRITNSIATYLRYVEKTIWPTKLAIFYPLQLTPSVIATLVAALFLITVSILTLKSIKSRPYLLVGWLWYLGTLVPVIGLVQVGSQAMADRYMYIPSIGLFVMIVWDVRDIVSRWPAARPWTIAVGAAALAGCMIVTSLQLRHWQNAETVFRHAAAVTPPNSLAQYMLGKTLVYKGQINEGLEHLNKALQINPTISAPHAVIAEVMQNRGNIREAIYHYREAIRYRPNSPPILNNLAWILATDADPAIRDGAEAVRLAELACSLTSHQSVLFIGTLAAAYAEAGRFDDAVKAAEKAHTMAMASGAKALAEKNQQLLTLYHQKKTYYETYGKD